VVLKPGSQLGPYEVRSLAGSGGMGEVYRARDTRLDRLVAVKILPPGVATDPVRLARFEREARTTAALAHPHICTLHDTGREGECWYFVTEYVDGETLQSRLVRGALPIDEALRYAIEIAEALDYAHRRHVLHRDIKPANIMLTATGVKLLDFGLAASESAPVFEGEQARSDTLTLTAEGTFLGTVQYAAPEQLEGKPVDARTDLFAFGAVLYEMLTGRRAFAGDSTASVIAAILSSAPPPVATVRNGVAPALDRLVVRLLAKDPEERWQTARDVLAELKWIQKERPEPRRVAMTRPLWAASTVGILVLAALAVTALWNSREEGRLAHQISVPFEIGPPPGTSFVPTLTNLSLSPDGRRLAFLASASPVGKELWIRDIASGRTRRLDGTEGALAPFWSPDSQWVAFEADGKLKKVNLAAGLPETVVSPGGSKFGGAWSVDGTLVFHGALGGPLFRVASGGGAAVAATRMDESRGELSHNWPSFLPDGRHFVFLSVNSKTPATQLWLASLDSDRRVPLLEDVSNTVYVPPGYLLFTRQGALFAQPFDASRRVLAGEATPLAEQVVRSTFGVPNGMSTFSVSASGLLAYRAAKDVPLTWLDRSCRVVAELGPPGQYSQPAISPDGTRLAVAKLDPVTGTPDVWMFDLQRGVGTPFTTDPDSESEPLWSPDGKQLAYFSNRRGHFELLAKASDSSTGEWQVRDRVMGVHDWSPDGRFIAYTSMEVNTAGHLALLSMRGDPVPWTTLRQVPKVALAAGDPRFSPDGRWIAYQGRESGRWEIYVSAFPSGAGKWQVSTDGGIAPRWRRDAGELFYIGLDGSLMAVRITDERTFHSSLPQRLCTSPVSGEGGAGAGRAPYDVAPDGQRFVFAAASRAQAAAGPITIVVNWPAKLRTMADR
jgi:serine/threonine protein kinase/Tol biopolymer transport system component